MKFTKGPWSAEINANGRPCVVTTEEPFTEICVVENMNMPMVEMAANARLIMCAPVMLDLLKAIKDWYDANEMPLNMHSIGLTDEDTTVRELLSDVISRATGKAA